MFHSNEDQNLAPSGLAKQWRRSSEIYRAKQATDGKWKKTIFYKILGEYTPMNILNWISKTKFIFLRRKL